MFLSGPKLIYVNSIHESYLNKIMKHLYSLMIVVLGLPNKQIKSSTLLYYSFNLFKHSTLKVKGYLFTRGTKLKNKERQNVLSFSTKSVEPNLKHC